MKAVVIARYGPPDVLQLKEVAKPVHGDREVLIKVRGAAVNATDPVFRTGRPYIARLFSGLIRPRNSIPGDVLAGDIEEVGREVTKFKKGDQVLGATTTTLGAHAEYICLSEDGAIARKPANISYEEAAGLCDGALTALPFLRDKGNIQKGQKVLVYGASGSVGTAAVQLAAFFGADVTGVCSTGNVEMVKSLGAHSVIDYTKEDFTQQGKTYDIIFDAVGKSTFARCKVALNDHGIYLTTVPTLGFMIQSIVAGKKGKKATFAATGLRPQHEKAKDLNTLGELAREGKIKTVIDRYYSLEQIVEAHRYVEQGHKKGNVVISVKHEG